MAQTPERPEEEPASSEEALAFVLQLQQDFLHAENSSENLATLDKRLKEFEPEKLKSLGNRVMMDIMKRPAQTIGPRKAGEPPSGDGTPPDKGGTPRKP
jgi:hypothetical protein